MWMVPGTRSFGGAGTTTTIVTLLLIASGFLIAFKGVVEFKRSSTTVNPLSPEKASELVTSGVFQHSRNPMYLGMVIVLIANGIYLGSPWLALVIAGFFLFINRFQIVPEERAMRDLFGESFQEYRTKVGRWL
jgi:protein-S-isoprenylcysteine O-methyltransferase Ste14